ncbi:SusD/RagB family nutrient-binding outer membrane lipoprotein [Chitinophaga deserti]|uniref:SusD/RagB family nutrient-binding outer membrane lipoprotein n=1 Tax=Chitinophaga deserti TaxID=2164099 RepID=UPI000D6ACEA0|nr:SusD/RagB family nutrient-binding outer membrane lipoprotein [Chitinophaga deserti]
MKKLIYIILGVGMLATSCKKDFLEINNTPNDATDATPQAVLTGALSGTGTLVCNTWQTYGAWTVGYWAKSNVVSGYNTYRTYNYTSATEQGVWNQSYNNLMDYEFIEKKAAALTRHEYFIALAKIMKAYVYQQVIDQYGNVPYSEALKGKANLTPAYDNAVTIYEDLIRQLDAAKKIIDETDPDNTIHVGNEDILFDGDLDRWKQLANSIKMRLLIRQSRVASRLAYITPLLTALAADPDGFLEEDAVVDPGYLRTEGKQNPFWNRYYMNAAGSSATEHDYVMPTTYGVAKVDHDRGVAIFGSTAASGVDLGDLNPPDATPFGAASIFRSYNQPVVIFQVSEMKFLLAEAVQELGINFGKTAKAFYEEGVAESFYYLMTSPAMIAYNGFDDRATIYDELVQPYLTSEEVDADWEFSPNKLKAIATQKWISMYLINSLEAWNEYRRTGYPNIPASLESIKPGQLPSRLLYPQTEESYNAANLVKQGKIDQFTSKIFWDVN